MKRNCYLTLLKNIVVAAIFFLTPYISFAQPGNDNCSSASNLTSTFSCTSGTSGNVRNATSQTTYVPGACGGATNLTTYDVWYRFTAVASTTTISLNNLGSSFGSVTPYVELLSGTCGILSLTSLACQAGTSELVATGLTVGTQYYIRIYVTTNPALSGTSTTWGFRVCVTHPVASTVATGKSFINITRPGGGAVNPGDELEIRVSVNVSTNNTRIFRTRFNDTIPDNLNYVPNSMRILTNEGKQYKAFTDVGGDDQGYYNAATRTVRFNLGRDTVGNLLGNLSSTGIDTSLGGGYFDPQAHFPRANGVLMIVTYRVIVDASVSYNTIFNYGSGVLRYRNKLSAAGATDIELAPNRLTFIVYPNYGLCSNASGLNYISAGNGDFGSGTSHNGVNPGTVPGYNYVSVATSNPGDGNYAVVKNLSPSESTNMFLARPEATATSRVFGVWDIIGDHTGAADPLAGNLPPANGVSGGYMLAVNSAFQLSVANNQIITGLCENTYYEFSAWFRNVCKRCGIDSAGRGASGVSVNAAYIPTALGDSSGVKPNLTFQINGVDYYLSGDIDYAGNYGQWVKKGFVFVTAPGQTSLTISIKNNAPGGGGNDWVMDDISFQTCLPTLNMRPSNSPTYCQNNQVDISVAVATFFNNYDYYRWERSTDNGATWVSAPEMPGVQTFGFTNYSGEYRDTASLPSFLASNANNGYRYRIRVATTTTNLSTDACALYNSTDIITINVSPSCDVLPAQILQFNIQLKENKSNLLWKVKQENNLLAYVVERSNDGNNFSAIGTLAARGALHNEEQYLFNDPALVTGKVYYRLKLTGIDGAIKYSNILSVSAGQQQIFAITNLVNPFVNRLSFQLNTYLDGPVDVQLTDASGRLIIQKKMMAVKGMNAIVVNAPGELQKGTFFLRVVSDAGVVNKVIQKQ